VESILSFSIGGSVEPRGGRVDNDRLVNLDIDIDDIVSPENFLTLGGDNDTVITRKRSRCDTNLEDDRGRFVSSMSQSDDIGTGPLHIHRIKGGMKARTQVKLPNVHKRMNTDRMEF
jgi:hypothetical protein